MNDVIMVITYHRFVHKIALFFGCHAIKAVFLKESSRNLEGLIEQMKKDGRIQNGGLGAVMAEEEAGINWEIVMSEHGMTRLEKN